MPRSATNTSKLDRAAAASRRLNESTQSDSFASFRLSLKSPGSLPLKRLNGRRIASGLALRLSAKAPAR
ncbi:hypothetical protein F01_450050 [Burkholderia cenocepacia]|nr:hypothetical protein F01_450050 [Burkholderia cenocepacia]